MINAYVLKLINNRVVLSEYADSTLSVLKNRGEKEQAYHETKFWSWFKQKIEYKDEELSFIVITDNKEFLIPESAHIKLHKTSSLDNDSYINDKIISNSDSLFVLSFPQRNTTFDKKEVQNEEEREVLQEEILSENTLTTYFRKQTQSYRNE